MGTFYAMSSLFVEKWCKGTEEDRDRMHKELCLLCDMTHGLQGGNTKELTLPKNPWDLSEGSIRLSEAILKSSIGKDAASLEEAIKELEGLYVKSRFRIVKKSLGEFSQHERGIQKGDYVVTKDGKLGEIITLMCYRDRTIFSINEVWPNAKMMFNEFLMYETPKEATEGKLPIVETNIHYFL